MRREKERHEREREDLRGIVASKRRLEQNEARNLNVLLQQVDDLMRLFPEMNVETSTNGSDKPPETYTPTPPRRLKVTNFFSNFLEQRGLCSFEFIRSNVANSC